MAKTFMAVACKTGDLEQALRESIPSVVSDQLDALIDQNYTRNGFDDEPIPYELTAFGLNARLDL